jgi:hypothetical protein
VNRFLPVLVLALGVLAITVGSAGAEVSKRSARLQLAAGNPVKIRGTGFLSGERVRVRVVAGSAGKRKTVSAGRSGVFVATFPTISRDRCSGLFAEAVGNGGSHAQLKLRPQQLCPPN